MTGGFYHESYDSYNNDYDVAVLRVCPDFDIAIDFSKYVMCFVVICSLSHSSFYAMMVLQFVCSNCCSISHIHIANIKI